MNAPIRGGSRPDRGGKLLEEMGFLACVHVAQARASFSVWHRFVSHREVNWGLCEKRPAGIGHIQDWNI